MRPVLRQGIDESLLYAPGGVVAPFHVVELDLYGVSSMPPHCEDWGFHERSLKVIAKRSPQERHAFIKGTLSPSVNRLFERTVHLENGTAWLLNADGGPRSLGTIVPRGSVLPGVTDKEAGGMRFRLTFTDADGARFHLAVNDLAWRYYWAHQRKWGKWDAKQTQQQMRATLAGRAIYLRVGLARGWKEHPDRCYLQVTAIHTFPDYLEQQTFANFAPPASA